MWSWGPKCHVLSQKTYGEEYNLVYNRKNVQGRSGLFVRPESNSPIAAVRREFLPMLALGAEAHLIQHSLKTASG